MPSSAQPPIQSVVRLSLSQRTALLAVFSLLAALVSLVAGPLQQARAATPVPIPAAAATATGLPTVQTDGIVFTLAIVGDTVYAGGRFTKARPAGTDPGSPDEVPRNNLLAFSLSTGELLPWAPVVTGTEYTSATKPDAFCKTVATDTYLCDTVFRIKATPDGSKIFVGGDFTDINGIGRQRVAEFDTSSGNLDPNFKPALNGRVHALAVTDDTVYVGGDFLTSDTTPRTRLAAYTLSGTLLPWAPSADKAIWSMTVAPSFNKVIIGGNFDIINSTTIHGLEAVDATTGDTVPWAFTTMTADTVVTDLINDGSSVYVSGFNFQGTAGTSRFEGRMSLDLSTGATNWIDACFGDTQSIAMANGLLYSASHSHDCQYMNGHPQTTPPVYQRLTAETTTVGGHYQGTGTSLVPTGAPIPALVQWFPDTDGGPSTSAWKNGPWSVAANSNYVVYGGEFLTVNGAPQQSLVRFTSVPTSTYSAPIGIKTPVPTVQADGSVRVAFTDTYDPDSPTLRYDLLRSDKGTVAVDSITLSTTYWNLSTQTLTDRTLPAGQSATYRVKAFDPNGRTATTNPSASVTGTATLPAFTRYPKAVNQDNPINYWRLNEASGATRLRDVNGGDDLTVRSAVTVGQPGAIGDSNDTGALFGGNTTNGLASSTVSRYAPDAWTQEIWFKTTSTRGGQLLGWSASNNGTSTTSDRKLYLDNSGRVFFGVSPGAKTTINSTSSYKDGAWHLADASLGADGMRLYVDGVQVASNPSVTLGQFVRTGFWRLGNDTLSGWPSAPSNGGYAVTLDDAAIYNTQLPASSIAAHWTARTPPPPVSTFTSSCTGRQCSFDGSGSTSQNGAISSYSWNFGDGSTDTGATSTHRFGSDGPHTVTLTVTDPSTLTDSNSQTVTVANAPPSAAFTVSCNARSCTVDATSSTDADGSITSVGWTFGDDATAAGTTASHTYAADGTYPITVTVTDDAGASSTLTKQANVAGAAPIAGFTSSCTDLACSFDASGTQAGTAPLTDYAWDYGDSGSAGTGATVDHTYATTGTYSVTLTVTDAEGKTDSVTHSVRAAAPVEAGSIATDGFVRSVTSGWGTADLGGAWTVAGTAANYAVSAGAAKMTLPTTGSTRTATLNDTTATDTDLSVEGTLDKLPAAGSVYIYALSRQVSTNTDYRARVRFMSDGSVRLQFVRRAGTATDVTLGSETVISGLTAAPDTALKIRFRVTGTSPTTLQARVWAASGTEPSTWSATVSDSTAALQAPGNTGLAVNSSSSNTAVPLVATFRGFSVKAP